MISFGTAEGPQGGDNLICNPKIYVIYRFKIKNTENNRFYQTRPKMKNGNRMHSIAVFLYLSILAYGLCFT